MSMKIKLIPSLLCALGLVNILGALVPPHPKYENIPSGYESTLVEMPSLGSGGSNLARPIPNNILVLRVQFTDVQFQSQPAYPDSLVHDAAFFNRWMLHLSDFYADASHYHYDLNWTLYPDVITMPHTLDYYGADGDSIDIRLNEFTQTLVELTDPNINYSLYGGVIIFHAGAGQESDISGINTGEIWSTFLTRKRLQMYFDPDNDLYPGYPTNDGINLTNLVIYPESEYQDYFPGPGEENADVYLFSIYGVLCHQFGHLIGLPSLFDNDSSNGASQGIGNFGLMGTGVWNASGYVPAQLDPWCRMHLGWEPVITVTQPTTNLAVDYFLNQDEIADLHRLYKIPISASEYFLVENRQQNPDGSLDPYNGLPSYTFKLLPPGEQDYYENYPLLPYFNFMENRYLGCEWDFFLPGLGGPIPMGMSTPQEGSGLLIWHIDENVIAENFTANFDLNTVNAYAPHKGIDIEEADGVQNLDTAAADQYKYGSPYDTFRQGNNVYFGNPSHNGILSLPTSESYYGGIPLEIYDISASGNKMTFSVGFGWSLSAGYSGENNINACMVDFDQDGSKEIFYPMPNGNLYMWKDELLMSGFPMTRLPMEYNYVWDGSDFYLPMQLESIARLFRLGSASNSYVANMSNSLWAAQPVSQGNDLYLAVNNTETNAGWIYRYDKEEQALDTMAEFDEPVCSNLVLFRNQLYIPTQMEGALHIWRVNLNNGVYSSGVIDVPADSVIVGIFKAPILPQSENGELIIQFANSLYLYNEDLMLPGMPSEKRKPAASAKEPVTWTLVNGFPYIHDMHTTAPLTIGDWDTNGSLDLILSSDRGVAVIDYSGSRISPSGLNLAASDSLSFNSGAMVQDIDHDGQKELLGSFMNNRLSCWEQDFRPKAGFPVSFANRSRFLPLIGEASDGAIYSWVAADNGSIFRKSLPDAVLTDLDPGWSCEYGNLLRQASRDDASLPNQYASTELFIPNEVYIYPNPLKSIYDNKLTLNLMTNRDTEFEVKIFDINGSLIYKQTGQAKAYLRNRDLIDLPESKMHSGVYIAVISANLDSCKLKFAVEK
jgi:M6 family metalloprotease-like protein